MFDTCTPTTTSRSKPFARRGPIGLTIGLTIVLCLAATGMIPRRGEADSAIRADYAFPRENAGNTSLAFAENEIWVVPFNTVSEWDAGDRHPYDEYVLKLALQGLLNRDKPRVWLSFIGWDRHMDTWKDYYGETRGYTFRKLDGGLDALLAKTAPAFNGIILYDAGNPANPTDNMVLALNLANLNFCLPVSKRIYEQRKAAFGPLSVAADLSNLGWDRKQTYDWLVGEALPHTNRDFGHSLCLSDAATTLGLAGANYIHGLDYAFYKRCLIFNLSPCVAPYWWNNRMVSGDAESGELLDRVLGGLNRPANLIGWSEPEEVFCMRISRFGHYLLNTAAGCNLSFHAGVKPLSPPPYRQNNEPKIQTPEKKIYLAFASNEGDSTPHHVHFAYGAWKSPARGKLPLNWTINPLIAEQFPAVMEYYFRTKTDKDYFYMGGCGAGYYSMRDTPPVMLRDILNRMDKAMRLVNVREGEVWYGAEPWLDMYFRYLPNLRGLLILPANGPPNGEVRFTATKRGTMIRYAKRFHYWWEFVDYKNKRIDAEKFQAYMNELSRTEKLPIFMPIYGMNEDMPEWILELQKRIDPKQCEIVDMGTLFHLARVSNKDKPTPARRATSSPKHRWSDAIFSDTAAWDTLLNNASTTVTSSGLTIKLAPTSGVTWGMAAIDGLQIPSGAYMFEAEVAELPPGARWVIKMNGDLDGLGYDTDWVPFGETNLTGTTVSIPLDPRVCRMAREGKPFRLLAGLVGPGGSTVKFGGIRFRTEEASK